MPYNTIWRIAVSGCAIALLSACASVPEESSQPPIEEHDASQPLKNPEEAAEQTQEESQDPEGNLDCSTLGVSINDLPARWNEYVELSGSGFSLPTLIEPTGDLLGLNQFTQYLDDTESALSAINLYWHPQSQQVREITIYGDVATSADLTLRLTNTAGAMIYSVTDLTVEESERFLVDELMVGVNTLEPGGFVMELVETDTRAFRFNVAGGGADWSAVGFQPCPKP